MRDARTNPNEKPSGATESSRRSSSGEAHQEAASALLLGGDHGGHHARAPPSEARLLVLHVLRRAEHPDRRLYIVNISSLSEYTSSVLRGDYCLAKAGTGMLTKLFADRMSEYGIPVNEVRPGIIATDMTAAAKDKYDKLFAAGFTPFRRWGQPEEIARSVRALVSGDFDFATGAALDLDGGFHLHRL